MSWTHGSGTRGGRRTEAGGGRQRPASDAPQGPHEGRLRSGKDAASARKRCSDSMPDAPADAELTGPNATAWGPVVGSRVQLATQVFAVLPCSAHRVASPDRLSAAQPT